MALLTGLAMQQHDESGEMFPIHYTCLGWEAASIYFSNDIYILSAPPPTSNMHISAAHKHTSTQMSNHVHCQHTAGVPRRFCQRALTPHSI